VSRSKDPDPSFLFVLLFDLSFFFFSQSGKRVLTGGLERVLSWSVRSGELMDSFGDFESSESSVVTRLVVSPDGVSFAAGYSNGAVRIWGPGEQGKMEVRSTFTGHTRPVTCLAFSSDGSLLATGSQSTEVLVWDVLGQAGRARLKGHKSAVTSLVFGNNNKLISASKDTLVLVWDLTLQQCVQTLVGHRHEVWDVVLDPNKRLLVTGSSDNKLRVWRLEGDEFVFYGGIDRSTEARVSCMTFCSSTRLVVQTAAKAVEVFALNEEATRQKKMKRRLKREQKKLESKLAQLEQSVGVPGFDLAREQASLEERYKPGARASDELVLSYAFAVSHRLHRMATKPGHSVVAFVSNRNELMLYRIGSREATLDVSVELPGHRSDVRALALNSNDAQLLSASQSTVKLWNSESGKCDGTVEIEGSALCAAFLPLDSHAVVGTKG
jgi:U3 small nucleolar RNA-associated protein 12